MSRRSLRRPRPEPPRVPAALFVPARSSARILGSPLSRFVILEQGHGQWVRGRKLRRVWRAR